MDLRKKHISFRANQRNQRKKSSVCPPDEPTDADKVWPHIVEYDLTQISELVFVLVLVLVLVWMSPHMLTRFRRIQFNSIFGGHVI